MKIEPYLTFNGKCEEAFNFYKEVFGGEFTMMSKYSDMPESDDYKPTEEEKNKVLHVSLPIGPETVLMGSDSNSHYGETKFGDNLSVSVQTDSEEQTNELFKKISESGEVAMPPAKQFWNAYFGACKDKFGISWMFNYNYPVEEQGSNTSDSS